MRREEAGELARNRGFSNWGFFPAEKLRFLTEVRDMCVADRCGKFGKTWTCPPACGTLEEITGRARAYSWGILLQTTGQMEDAFDAETLVDAMEKQKENFGTYVKGIRKDYPGEDILPMSSGGCDLCGTCTYPEESCRFPEQAVPSMEAYGLLVTEVCELAGIPYYYGKNTITFSSCILFH